MKRISIAALAAVSVMATAMPTMAATHHHGKKSAGHAQKSASGEMTTDQLNARSLQQAQTPVPATQPPAAPMAMPTTPSAPMPPPTPSVVPENAPVPPKTL